MGITSVIDSANKVPGAYIRVSLGVGRRSPGAGALRVLVAGNKTSAGSSVASEVYPVFSPDEATSLFGAGSELDLMCRAALKANPTVELHALVVAESAGVNATGTLVFGGGPATSAGAVEILVNGVRVVAPIAIGDTVTVIGDSAAAAINALTNAPVTALNAAGTVTVTAKNKGPRGNFIRLRSLKTGGAAVTHTSVNAYLAGGATSDDPQAALDAVQPQRYHHIAAPYSDSTNIAKFEIHCDTAAEPVEGRRQRFFYASQASLATTITLGDAINAKRGELLWHFNAEDTPGEIAAGAAAMYSAAMNPDRAANLDGKVIRGLKPQFAVGDKPTTSELVSALNNGISPLSHDGQSVFVVRPITNYSTDSNSQPDYSVLDTANVAVPDFIADAIADNFASEFEGFKLDNDPPQGETPEPNVATPSSIEAWLYSILTTFAAGGPGPLMLQRAEELKDEIVVEIDSITDGRVNAIVPVDVVPRLHQLGVDVKQIG